MQTCSRFVLVILPLRSARSDSNIRSALLKYCIVIGQLIKSFSHTNPTNALSVGFPIIPWNICISFAFLTSCLVYLSKFSQTVFTTWAWYLNPCLSHWCSGAFSCLTWIPLYHLWYGLDKHCCGPSYCRQFDAFPLPSTTRSCWQYHGGYTPSWCSLYLPLGQNLLIPRWSVVWSYRGKVTSVERRYGGSRLGWSS